MIAKRGFGVMELFFKELEKLDNINGKWEEKPVRGDIENEGKRLFLKK